MLSSYISKFSLQDVIDSVVSCRLLASGCWPAGATAAALHRPTSIHPTRSQPTCTAGTQEADAGVVPSGEMALAWLKQRFDGEMQEASITDSGLQLSAAHTTADGNYDLMLRWEAECWMLVTCWRLDIGHLCIMVELPLLHPSAQPVAA